MTRRKRPVNEWFGQKIEPGTSASVRLPISESYLGFSVEIPLRIQRAAEDGPTVFITAALHGDEINGTGAIQTLIQDPEFHLARGTLILVPVLNVLGFDRHSRYLPDRRDLNRCFPGSSTGSLASRMARRIFDEIVMRCDYGIDLHTAAIRRTNYPNLRADMQLKKVRRMAQTFGCECILDGPGPKGSLRREACAAGCPTIVMEAGEVWKVEPTVVHITVSGIKNILADLGMFEGTLQRLEYQVRIRSSTWIRAERGGFLQFHVKPGQIVETGQPLATTTSLAEDDAETQHALFDGIILGMTTLPAVSPGEPICNLGRLPDDMTPRELTRLRRKDDAFQKSILKDLATNVLIVDPDMVESETPAQGHETPDIRPESP